MNAPETTDVHADLQARRSELLDARGACSRAFGAAKRAGEDLAPLKERMQAITAELRALEAQLTPTEGTAAAARSEVQTPPNAATTGRPDFAPAPEPAATPLELDTNPQADSWDAYLQGHPRARASHLYAMGEAILTNGATALHRVLARRGEKVVGIACAARLQSPIFGDYLVGLPWINYGGPLGDSPEVEEALANHLGQVREALGSRHLELRDERRRGDTPCRDDKVTMELALPSTKEVLRDGYRAKLRSQIRRAEREGPECRIGGLELLEDFYAVFAGNMRDLGTPIHPRKFFADIFGVTDRTNLVVIYHRGKPVACAFLQGYGDTLEIPWASTLRSANRISANMFLYAKVLDFAVEEGYQRFDFGRCSRHSNTWAFKAQWGAVERPLFWHYHLPAGEDLPRLNPSNPKYALMIAVWQRLPVWLVNRIGPFVIRGLP